MNPFLCECVSRVQQFYAPAGHGVQDGIQPSRPRKPSCVHNRRQCVISFSFSLRASLKGVGWKLIYHMADA
jgi:hypothetical protein